MSYRKSPSKMRSASPLRRNPQSSLVNRITRQQNNRPSRRMKRKH